MYNINNSLFFSMFLIPLKEEDDKMEFIDYIDLGITSTKKPFNTHLLWEHSTYGIMMVDSTNQAVLLFSTIARLIVDASDWDTVNLTDNTNSYKIQAGWLDGNDLWLVSCDNDGTADDFEVFFIELDDSNDCNPIGVSAGAQANTVYAYDIFKIGVNHYVLNMEQRAGLRTLVIWDVDVGIVESDSIVPTLAIIDPISQGVVIGTDYYVASATVITEDMTIYYFDSTGPTITIKDNIFGGGTLSSNINQRGLSYDGSDIIYFITDTGGDHILSTYTISTNTLAISGGVYDIALMLDRNTASGILEKAFHLTEYKVYQLHPVIAYQIYLISTPASDAVFIGITDSFLINNDGDMFEYGDLTSYVLSCNIRRDDMEVPTATIQILKPYVITEGMFIVIKDMFTTAGSSSNSIIFEGFVDSLSEGRAYTALLISPANEMENIRPSGDFSGRSDQIISSLITTYCKYITVGTLSAGGAMGTITFYGDKTMIQILTELAIFDSFIWSLGPTGKLFYNNGTVDTTINFNDNSHISEVKKLEGKRAINYVKIKGGFASGVQVVGTVAESVPDQQTNGKNPYERTHSHLNTNALCSTTATNALSRLGTQAKVVEFAHNDNTVGLMQEGETVTFERVGLDFTISSAQYGIRSVRYNAVTGKGYYIISDRII